MHDIEMIVLLLGIIAVVGILTKKSTIPLSLYLVIVGIILSPFLNYPLMEMHPEVVLNVFLPLLIYAISFQCSIKEFKKNARPILMLSVGHVIFITTLIACALHYFIPAISWPLAFIMGAVLSPPDDVAITEIAEKIKFPARIVTILEGEGMLNDATALILLRFSLIAFMTQHFSIVDASLQFLAIIVGETIYGIFLGHLLGKARLYIKDPILHMTVSIITPFIAYLPPSQLGGSGLIATVVTGVIIGNYYSVKFSAQFRILSLSVWPTISFVIQGFLFLMVGINITHIYESISAIPTFDLLKIMSIIVVCAVVGRFIWVFPSAYLPRYFSKRIRAKDPYPPWQYPFIVGWAGMRGGISLAAALIVPSLPVFIDNVNARDLVTFMAFTVIFATLVLQGLSLPWIIKIIGLTHYTKHESHHEKTSELDTRIQMADAAIHWLNDYKKKARADEALADEIDLIIRNYEKHQDNLMVQLKKHQCPKRVREIDFFENISLYNDTIEAEKTVLIQLWQEEKISLQTRNKLLQELDYRYKTTLS